MVKRRDVKLLAVAFLRGRFVLHSNLLFTAHDPFPAAHGIAAKLSCNLADNGRRRIPFGPLFACAVIGTFLVRLFYGGERTGKPMAPLRVLIPTKLRLGDSPHWTRLPERMDRPGGT